MNGNYFFVHIPKTAGTSFCTSLKRNKHVRMLYDYGKKIPASTPELVEIAPEELTSENPIFHTDKYNFICGHVKYARYAHCVSLNSVMSIVRNPVERLVSEYQHLKRHGIITASFKGFYLSKAQQNKQWTYLGDMSQGNRGLIGLTSHYKFFVEVFSIKFGLKMESIMVNQAPTSDVESRFQISPDDIRSAYRHNKKDINLFFREANKFNKLVQEIGYNTIPHKDAKWSCRVDDHKRRVVGWVSCSSKDCYFVEIKADGYRRVIIALDQERNDVYEKGLSENPVCGFSYPLALLGVEPGSKISIGLLGAPSFVRTLAVDSDS